MPIPSSSVTLVKGPVIRAGASRCRLTNWLSLGIDVALLVSRTRLIVPHRLDVKKNRNECDIRRISVLWNGRRILSMQLLGKLFRPPVRLVRLAAKLHWCRTLLASRWLLNNRLCAQTTCLPRSMSRAATAVLTLIMVMAECLGPIVTRAVSRLNECLSVQVLMLIIPVASLVRVSVVLWILMPLP